MVRLVSTILKLVGSLVLLFTWLATIVVLFQQGNLLLPIIAILFPFTSYVMAFFIGYGWYVAGGFLYLVLGVVLGELSRSPR